MARGTVFDPDFGTATQALAALRRGAVSSRELTAHVLARIDKVNPAPMGYGGSGAARVPGSGRSTASPSW